MAKIIDNYFIFNFSDSATESQIYCICSLGNELTLSWGSNHVSFIISHNERNLFPLESNIKFDFSSDFPVKPVVYSYFNFGGLIGELGICEISIFVSDPEKACIRSDSVKKVERTDYSLTVSHLEEKGYVNTSQSFNFLRTDERKFKIEEKAIVLIPELKEYIHMDFEVDILGTKAWSKLTDLVVSLWEKLV